MRKRFYESSIQIFFLFLFMIVAALIQGGWALWDYRSRGSYAWLDCDIFVDLFLLSLPPVALICILNILFFSITSKRILSTVISAFVLMSSCLIIDIEIFIDKEASWSTHGNVWYEGLSLAAEPILAICLIFVYPFYQLSRRISFCTKC